MSFLCFLVLSGSLPFRARHVRRASRRARPRSAACGAHGRPVGDHDPWSGNGSGAAGPPREPRWSAWPCSLLTLLRASSQSLVQRADTLLEEEEELDDPVKRQQSLMHWSAEQQHQLEEALRPHSGGHHLDMDQWSEVASHVEGKSGVECMDRTLYLHRLAAKRRLSVGPRPPPPPTTAPQRGVAAATSSGEPTVLGRASGLLSSLFSSRPPGAPGAPPPKLSFPSTVETLIASPLRTLPAVAVPRVPRTGVVQQLFAAFSAHLCPFVGITDASGAVTQHVAARQVLSWLAVHVCPVVADHPVLSTTPIDTLLAFVATDAPIVQVAGSAGSTVRDAMRVFATFPVAHAVVLWDDGTSSSISASAALRTMLPLLPDLPDALDSSSSSKQAPTVSAWSDELLVSALRVRSSSMWAVQEASRTVGVVSIHALDGMPWVDACAALHASFGAWVAKHGTAPSLSASSATLGGALKALATTDAVCVAVVADDGTTLVRTVTALTALQQLVNRPVQ